MQLHSINIFEICMPNPSASSKIELAAFKIFWPHSIFFECGQIFLTMLKYANLQGKISLLTKVKKIWTPSNYIEHSQKILSMVKIFLN